MIHTTEEEQELMVIDVLSARLEEAGDKGLSVAAVVRELVDRGLRREDAISTLHQEIASGHINLTNGFMVIAGE